MKLIIYWLTIIAILPLFYIWWWKKQWRLILGASIIAIVAAGLFFPGEITYSILTREIEKEAKKTDDIINTTANQKSDSENSQKIEEAKEIVELNKEIKKLEEQIDSLEKHLLIIDKKKLWDLKKQLWIRKWAWEKFLSTLLFCGNEFNEKLASKNYEKYEDLGKEIKSKIATENIIDFANYSKSNPEEVKEKIFDIIKKVEKEYALHYNKKFSIIWLKNIDQITNQELEKLLLEMFDPKTNKSFWKYKDKDNNEITPNLLKFIFVVTTSNYKPKISEKLQTRLHHIEPTLDKYFWTIIFSSAGIEIIIFALLIRNKKKTENKAFKKFGY